MLILVIGLYPAQSGKTVFSASLVSQLRREGFKTVPFKPVGGTDIWENPSVLVESRRMKVLVTGDALALRRPIGEYPIELINPLGFIITHIDPERISWKVRDSLSMQSLSSRTALARVSFCRDRIYTTHMINMDAVRRSPSSIETELLETASALEPKPLRINDSVVDSILGGIYVNEVDECLRRVASDNEVTVIESNSNVAAPTIESSKPDIVVAISPGMGYVIDGRRFHKAITVSALAGKPWSVDSEEVIALTGVAYKIQLPLLDDPIEGYTYNDLKTIIELVKSALRR